jgi:hypothetical protein
MNKKPLRNPERFSMGEVKEEARASQATGLPNKILP